MCACEIRIVLLLQCVGRRGKPNSRGGRICDSNDSFLLFRYRLSLLHCRGGIFIVLVNLSDGDYVVHRGDRVAQLIVEEVRMATVIEVERLPLGHGMRNGPCSTGR